MAFNGTFSGMPLPDLLQWLAMGRKTGMLQVRSPIGVSKKVWFRDGRVSAAASSDPREYLGHFLVARALVNEKQLEMALTTQEQTGIKLGKILVTIAAVTQEQLDEVLQTKIQETVFSLFLWPVAEFEFYEGDTLGGDLSEASIDATFLIMEGTRRQDEFVRIKAALPGTEAVMEMTGVYPGAELAEEYPLALSIFERMDGARNLASIGLDLHALEYDLLAAAMALIEAGSAKVVAARPDAEQEWQKTVHQQIFSKTVQAFAAGQYAQAGNLCHFLIQKGLFVEEARNMLAACDEKTKVDWDKEIPLDGIPVLVGSLAHLSNQALSPQEGFLVSRLDGNYSVRSILKITPIPELDARRALKNMKDKGIIAFKAAPAPPPDSPKKSNVEAVRKTGSNPAVSKPGANPPGKK